MTDTAVLNDAAETLLNVLVAGATDADWVPTALVAAGEPSYDCDALYVWVDQIVPEIGAGGCVTASRVQFRYALADCVGADKDETEIFESAAVHHARVWAVWVSLVADCCNDGAILGEQSDIVRVGTLSQLTTAGGLAVWSGTVTAVVSPLALT
jgi:hypothetical protein